MSSQTFHVLQPHRLFAANVDIVMLLYFARIRLDRCSFKKNPSLPGVIIQFQNIRAERGGCAPGSFFAVLESTS